MIRKYKKTLIISSLLILLPTVIGLLLRNQLPEMIPTHWGLDGQADGWSSVYTAIFLLPLILLAFHWLCVWITAKTNQHQNEKLQVMVLWIIPVLSNLCCGLMYAIALDSHISVTNIMTAAMGLMFVVIGNYMPKCRMNATIGIKIYWAYTSEENWNATHRFAGKVWFIGGLLILFTLLLPTEYAIVVFLIATLILVLLPVVFSWRYYRKQVARGDELKTVLPVSQKSKRASLLLVALILAGMAYLMFTGDITFFYHSDSFTVKADFCEDLTVAYDAIDSIEYRTGNVDGARVMGFGSARLLMGTFENEEFGYYTRYTYTNPDACIVIRAGDQVLVLSSQTASQTKSIYLDLLDLTGLE